jgi:hypothetical protein
MKENNLHVADEQLLLHASGELRSSLSAQIQAHLDSCQECKGRLVELEGRQAEFGEARRAWAADLPSRVEPRARLEARLAELAARDRQRGWLPSAWSVVTAHREAAVFAGVAVAIFLVVAIRFRGAAGGAELVTASAGRWEEPDLRLTPGATVPVTEGDICGAAEERAVPVVPVSLKRKVFEEYGVTPPRPDAYEVDYLITPELGGATDIRNLWPEPYQNTVWNAHVKDQLEERLHRMVCHGDVDLATAQHDISSDWIAAYRKYFHVDKPISDNPSGDDAVDGSLPRT